MKIGVYGGTFNPVHNGHITAARAAVKALGLDKLLLLPANVPPHKQLPLGSASAQQRLEMAELAAGVVGKLAQADGIELQRTGKSYTSDSLRLLHRRYPEDELWLLMGSDMFLSLHHWHEPEVICALAHIGAFHRVDGRDEGFLQQKALLEQQFGAHVTLIDNEDIIPISSTQVREALAKGEGEKLLPTAVWGYVRRCHLYGTAADLTSLTVDELRPIAMSYLKPKRMPHVLGTEQEAVRLVERYGGDPQEARVAALLHDCTKKLEMPEQLALCREFGLTLDEVERQTLKLLHSRTGAEIAHRTFAVSDEVYTAIRWHTTGRANMTRLEKILYLADYIEPTREFEGVDALRKAVYEDLDRGLLLGLTMTIREMESEGRVVHHRTMDARNDLIKKGVTL